MFSPKIWPQWRRYAVSFGIQVTTNFHSITGLSLISVFISCGLNQKSIFSLRFPHTFYSIFVGFDKCRRLSRLHVWPHPLKQWYFWVLKRWTNSSIRSCPGKPELATCWDLKHKLGLYRFGETANEHLAACSWVLLEWALPKLCIPKYRKVHFVS